MDEDVVSHPCDVPDHEVPVDGLGVEAEEEPVRDLSVPTVCACLCVTVIGRGGGYRPGAPKGRGVYSLPHTPPERSSYSLPWTRSHVPPRRRTPESRQTSFQRDPSPRGSGPHPRLSRRADSCPTRTTRPPVPVPESTPRTNDRSDGTGSSGRQWLVRTCARRDDFVQDPSFDPKHFPHFMGSVVQRRVHVRTSEWDDRRHGGQWGPSSVHSDDDGSFPGPPGGPDLPNRCRSSLTRVFGTGPGQGDGLGRGLRHSPTESRELSRYR